MLSLLLAADPQRNWIERLAALWPVWLPLILGAAAVFVLLPRPRAYPAFWGVAAGVLALLLGGWRMVQAGVIWQETLLFYSFSAVAVVAGTLLVTQQNPARAALSFALVVLATCGLFLLLAAPFLMAATIVVYAGAIVVTFLFVLMLAQQEGRSDADARSREPLLATLTGFVLLGALLYVIKAGSGNAEIDRLQESITNGLPESERADPFLVTERLMTALNYPDLLARTQNVPSEVGMDQAAQKEALDSIVREARQRHAAERLVTLRPAETAPLSDLSGPRAGVRRDDVRRDEKTGVPQMPADNAAYLGKSLFTDYLLPVELGGFLLLAATVGAVAIGQRRAKLASAGTPERIA